MNAPTPAAAFAAVRDDDFQSLFAEVGARAAERDRERVHPTDVIALLRERRVGALRLPVEEGGRGYSLRRLLSFVIGLAAADSNVAHALRNHYAFVDRFALPHAVPGRERWSGLVATGAIVGVANTELTSAKIGASDYATTLTQAGDGYLLNGRKYYSTGALYADFVLIRAVLPDGRPASAIIPVERDGVELVDDWDGAGQRLTGSGTTVLRDVRVEADEVIPDTEEVGYGVPYANTLAQLIVTGVVAGICRNVLADASALLGGRKERHFYYASSERAADDPVLLGVIGEISASAFAAESVVLAAADALDLVFEARRQGLPAEQLAVNAAAATARAKLVADELTLRAATRLFDVGGASATKRTAGLDRHWRNARTLSSHNPTPLKASALGAYALHGTPLPSQGFF
ncbi:acyl-CoA dehydrogenase [Chenggangzhangella methanolivorans]|uniref:Acyl-CoA dehydrogenase n=1 Tax=Chenggangzhangella methanolivorans TaxID=1437009 RepID=A0A9E6UMZ0_9HYPH|nr:acyl-CoA dehydrogenase [Chenggangzhangella methanolivorans]QZO00496.1 acyl-CoA dehydrogenase [Chenggangzhangella methanolivorans]